MVITPREKQIIALLAKGIKYNEIGLVLGITNRTVKTHMGNCRERNQVPNNNHLIYLLAKSGELQELLDAQELTQNRV